MTKERKALEHKLTVLLNKGRDRGFITFDEILRVFPEIENNVDFLEEIYERMGVMGIDILESGGLLDADPVEEPVNTGASRKYLTTKSSPYDSTQMYLREIGQYPLLAARDERERAVIERIGQQATGEGLPPGVHDIGTWRIVPRSDGVAVIVSPMYECSGQIVWGGAVVLALPPVPGEGGAP